MSYPEANKQHQHQHTNILIREYYVNPKHQIYQGNRLQFHDYRTTCPNLHRTKSTLMQHRLTLNHSLMHSYFSIVHATYIHPSNNLVPRFPARSPQSHAIMHCISHAQDTSPPHIPNKTHSNKIFGNRDLDRAKLNIHIHSP